MADASNVQTGFLGGEFSPYAQGVLDDPEYKKGMNVCRNVIPIETGAATRRTGTKELAFTRKGQAGRLLNFQFTNSTPYTMELTDGVLRFYNSQQLVISEEPRTVLYINTATPAVMVTSASCGGITWNDGDTIVFNSLKPDTSAAGGALLGRQFVLRAGADDQHWTLFDALTAQPLDGLTVNWDNGKAIQVARVFEITTPYTNGAWQSLRATQSDDMVILWHPNFPPYVVFAPIDGGNLFTFNKAQFIDGPYLDPPTDGSYLTPTGLSGSVTLALGYPAWSSGTTYANGTLFVNNTQTRGAAYSTKVQYNNGAVVSSGGNYYVSIADANTNHSPPNATWWKAITINGFVSTDVGRSIRLLSEPALWVVGTAYSTGDLVKYQGAYYSALVGSTGKVPGTDATNWGVAANAAKWTWGIITAASTTSLTVAIQGDPILYNQNILTWRLGVFSDTTGYASCGAFHEGRLWTGGAVKNRFDTSGATGNIFDFTPTAPDGTVSDANGLSYTLKSKQRNQILWMTPALGGLLMGTSQCEWLVQSSANNDPITPTNIQAHDHTSLGSANVEAVRCGSTVAFVQRYGNQVLEYLADLFSGKPAGKNLAVRAKHLTGAGITRIGYQQELVPVLWCLTADGKLLGTTYKRESLMVSQPPNFNGWHRHDLGSGFKVIDLVVGSSPGGLYETATIMTQDPATGYCRVEALTEMFQETSNIFDSWFVDCGLQPSGITPATVNAITGVRIGGLGHLEGKTIDVFLAGLDLGSYTISGGTIFVPYLSDPDKLFTLAYLKAAASQGYKFNSTFTVPAAVQTETIMQFPPLADLSHWTYLNYGAQAVADWANDRVTFLLPGHGPTDGLVQYQISTGKQLLHLTTSQVFGAPNPAYYDPAATYSATPKVLGSDNVIYTVQVSNSQGVDPTSTGQTDWLKDNSNAPYGTVPAAYSSGTTYASGTFATSAGSIYRSLQNSNTGNTPASSPTWWQLYDVVPALWNYTTIYGTITMVTGSNDHLYWPWGDVAAGLGDPTSFSSNNNPYWQSRGDIWPVGSITSSGLSLDSNGDIWMYQTSTSFNSTYVKIDGATLKLKGFVTKAAGLSIPLPSNYSIPLRIFNNQNGSVQDLMIETVDTTPSGSSTPSVVIMDTTGMRINGQSTLSFDEGNHPVGCTGGQNAGYSQVFVLTRNGSATTASVGLYEISCVAASPGMIRQNKRNFLTDPNRAPELLYNTTSAFTKRKAGTIAPSDIDSAWSFFFGFSGLLYDPNDGNVMFFVSTVNPSNWSSLTTYNIGTGTGSAVVGSDGKVYTSKTNTNLNNDPTTDAGVHWTLLNNTTATNLNYMVKFSSGCAKLMWNIPVTNWPSLVDVSYPFINLSNSYLVYNESLGLGAWQVRQIDTLSGQSTIIFPGQAGLTALGTSQIYNSLTGDIILYPQYDNSQVGTSAPPTPVNPIGGTTPSSFTGWARWNVTPAVLNYSVSACVGFSFTSQGQLLRPVAPAESGARNGPAFGKTRRNHRYAIAVANTQGIAIGTDFSEKMRPAQFKSRSGKGALLLSSATLYTGEHSDTVENDYDLDGMLAWQVTRPYPATVTALGGFLQTQDR